MNSEYATASTGTSISTSSVERALRQTESQPADENKWDGGFDDEEIDAEDALRITKLLTERPELYDELLNEDVHKILYEQEKKSSSDTTKFDLNNNNSVFNTINNNNNNAYNYNDNSSLGMSGLGTSSMLGLMMQPDDDIMMPAALTQQLDNQQNDFATAAAATTTNPSSSDVSAILEGNTSQFLDSLISNASQQALATAKKDGKKRMADDVESMSSLTDELEDELFPGRGRKKRKAGGGHRGKRKLPDNISKMIGQANLHYVSRQFPEAVSILMEVVRKMPTIPDPYHTLGLIFEETNEKKKALEFYLIAAHLTPKDSELWRRLAYMSREMGNVRQALYCFNKLVRLEPDDYIAIWDRSFLYLDDQINEPKKALEGFKMILQANPDDEETAIEIAKIYHNKLGDDDTAIKTLEEAVEFNISKVDLTLVNMLCELYLAKGAFKQTVQLIDRISIKHTPLEGLPFDLTVKYAICLTYTGSLDQAEKIFNEVLKQDVLVYADLYYDIAETYFVLSDFDRALPVYEQLLKIPTYDKPAIWLKLGKCYQEARDQKHEAIAYYEKVVKEVPDNVEACIALSELYREIGESRKAVEILGITRANLLAVAPLSAARLGVDEWGENDEEEESSETEERVYYGGGNNPLYEDEDDLSDATKIRHASKCKASSSVPHVAGASGTTSPVTPSVPGMNKKAVQDIRLIVHKAFLHFSSEEYDEFINTCMPVVRELLRSSEPTRTTSGRKSRRKPRPHHSLLLLESDELEHEEEEQQQLDTSSISAAAQQSLPQHPETPNQTNINNNSFDETPVTTLTTATTPMDEDIIVFGQKRGNPRKGQKGKKASTTEDGQQQQQQQQQGEAKEEEKPLIVPTPADGDATNQQQPQQSQPQMPQPQSQQQQQSPDTKPSKQREKKAPVQTRGWTWQALVDVLGQEELFTLLYSLCKVLAYQKRYREASEIINRMLSSGKITDPNKIRDLKFMAVGIAFNSEDYLSAYDSVRYVLMQRPYSIPMWNLFNKIITRAGNFSTNHKFMVRMLAKHPQSVPLMILVGHNCTMSGSYRLALGEYLKAYQAMPEEPLINLCIGLSYLHLVMNRRTANRHLMAMQAFTFLNQYYNLRGGSSSQEAAYNMGRAYHQLNLTHLAVSYYEKVLMAKNPVNNNKKKMEDHDAAQHEHEDEREGGVLSINNNSNNAMHSRGGKAKSATISTSSSSNNNNNSIDNNDEESDEQKQEDDEEGLKREAAYNLSLLYRASGNDNLARQILREYCTV